MIYLTFDRWEILQERFDTIARHYGSSQIPELIIIHDPISQIRGEYLENYEAVIINTVKHDDMADMIQTLIHEFIHSIQVEDWGENAHIYEEKAESIAMRDYHLFM